MYGTDPVRNYFFGGGVGGGGGGGGGLGGTFLMCLGGDDGDGGLGVGCGELGFVDWLIIFR